MRRPQHFQEPRAKLRPHAAGLRGTIAGRTTICAMGKSGTGLTYRGYDVADLARAASFEEVAYLLLHDALPDASGLQSFRDELRELRSLPDALTATLEQLPAETHPMDVLRTCCSLLGSLEPERDGPIATAKRLLAVLPSALLYWYRFAHEDERIDPRGASASTARGFLELLHEETPSDLHAKALDTTLILFAEHELNASTFAARVCASTLSDVHSCITAAIGTLRGARDGGAVENILESLHHYETPRQAATATRTALARGDRILGFGHAVYKNADPRNAIVKSQVRRLAQDTGHRDLFAKFCAVEEVLWEQRRLPANADFFHAALFRMLGIPTSLFTAVIACARTAGWIAHVLEQRQDDRIIRPRARYAGPSPKAYVPRRSEVQRVAGP